MSQFQKKTRDVELIKVLDEVKVALKEAQQAFNVEDVLVRKDRPHFK